MQDKTLRLLRAPLEDGSSSVVTYLYDEDVDEIISRAVALGPRVLMPAEDQFWGDRVERIIDPAGHVWNIAARIVKNESLGHSAEEVFTKDRDY